jgi:Flp pilus assembly protein TadG
VKQRSCRALRADERGQTLTLFVLFLMSLLGMAAFAIDVGSWYQDRRHVQNDADAAALAGAAGLRTSNAVSTATANFNLNKLSGETINVSTPAYDTVQVTTTYQAPSFFSKLFGHSSTTVTASATAKIQGIGSAQHHVSPYVVTVASYNNGQGTTLFNCDASGNCGTVDLPTADNTTGGSCSGNVYTGISQNVVSAITDQIDIGELDIGGCLSPKTGNAQPSANSVNTLVGSMSQDLQSLGNGQYALVHQSWDDAQGLPPRLIFVPIVQSFATGTNANMTILGFAWFYITSATGSGQTLKINGQYVSMTMTATSKAVSWQPSQTGQITFVSLTG